MRAYVRAQVVPKWLNGNSSRLQPRLGQIWARWFCLWRTIPLLFWSSLQQSSHENKHAYRLVEYTQLHTVLLLLCTVDRDLEPAVVAPPFHVSRRNLVQFSRHGQAMTTFVSYQILHVQHRAPVLHRFAIANQKACGTRHGMRPSAALLAQKKNSRQTLEWKLDINQVLTITMHSRLLQPRETQDTKEACLPRLPCRVQNGRLRDILAPVGLVVFFTALITVVLFVLRQRADNPIESAGSGVAGWTSASGGPSGAFASSAAGPSDYCEEWHEQKGSEVVIPKSHLVESSLVADREANSYFVTAALVVSAAETQPMSGPSSDVCSLGTLLQSFNPCSHITKPYGQTRRPFARCCLSA